MRKGKLATLRAQILGIHRLLHVRALEPNVRLALDREMRYYNNRFMLPIAYGVLALEMLNIVHLLFFSKSGLNSPNNQRYFTMYLTLILGAFLGLLAQRLLRERPEALTRLYTGFAAFLMLWHAVLTAMDLRHNPNLTVFVSGTFVVAVLLRIRPWEALCIFSSGLLVLLVAAGKHLSSGNAINALIVVVVALFICFGRFLSSLEEIGYRQKMMLQEDRRAQDRQRLHLLLQQQQALLQQSGELLWIWEKQTGTLAFAGASRPGKELQAALLAWLSQGEKPEGDRLILPLSDGRVCDHRITFTIQYDADEQVIGAVGRLEPSAAVVE